MQGIFGTENLTITYDKGTPKEFSALKGVSFYAMPGEFVIVFGPSGCGKSTLLYMLSGIERHISGGEAWVNGKDVTHMDSNGLLKIHRHDIGMIFQAYNLIGTLNVLSNVTLPLLAMGIPESQRPERAMALLERFGVAHLAKRYPAELSGGQQQRVAIARALVTNPDIIFADEPTGNLDSASTEIVLKQLLALRAQDKKTILMVTHDPTFLHYADRVVWLKDGKLVKIDIQRGTQEFLAAPTTEETEGGRTSLSKKPNEFGTSPFDAERKGEISFEDEEKLSIVEKYVSSFSKEKEPVLRKRLHHILSEVITGKLLRKNALFVLSQPVLEGGMGLSLDEATNILIKIGKLFELRSNISLLPDEKKLSYESLLRISEWILGPLWKKMTSAQNDSFCEAVSSYLSAKIDRSGFSFNLKSPLSQGGAGLFGIDSERFAKKLDLIQDLIPLPSKENL